MLSIVTPYFEDEEQLKRYIAQDCFDLVDEVIIVDDGSEVEYAKTILSDNLDPSIKNKFRILRVSENLGFNAHGCRNLGVQQARSDWVLLIDVDMKFDKNFLLEAKKQIENLPENTFLGFSFDTSSSPDLSGAYPASAYKVEPIEYNTYAIRKKDFLSTRGYDEEFVNIHGGSRVFVERLMTKYERIMCPNCSTAPARMSREIRIIDGLEKVEYDQWFIYHPRTWDNVEQLLQMARERNEHPETWKEKSFINFDWYEETL